jgi:hypothetical protein
MTYFMFSCRGFSHSILHYGTLNSLVFVENFIVVTVKIN